MSARRDGMGWRGRWCPGGGLRVGIKNVVVLVVSFVLGVPVVDDCACAGGARVSVAVRRWTDDLRGGGGWSAFGGGEGWQTREWTRGQVLTESSLERMSAGNALLGGGMGILVRGTSSPFRTGFPEAAVPDMTPRTN